MIAGGVFLKFAAEPPRGVPFKNSPSCWEHEEFVDKQMDLHVQARNFTVESRRLAAATHPIQVEVGSSGKQRLCNNTKLNNSLLPRMQFKLETVQDTLTQTLREGYMQFTTDMAEAYYSIPLHRSSSRWLAWSWKGRCYFPEVMIFGLSLAPFLFHKATRPIITFCRALDMLVSSFLDDFRWAEQSANIDEVATFARWIFSTLGTFLSTKTNPTPDHAITFTGCNELDGLVALAEARGRTG
jgi:hypothetical protein